MRLLNKVYKKIAKITPKRLISNFISKFLNTNGKYSIIATCDPIQFEKFRFFELLLNEM
jgi:hypothetical protein